MTAAAGRPGLLRSTATITAWNAVSRATGFVRVLAVGAALGTTFLGNTYQSSNLVSNILFELLAAGLLSAPLVPVFVSMLDTDRHGDAERLAGSLLTLSVGGLGIVALAGMVAGPGIMRLLTVGVTDRAVREAEVRLGAFWLWFFLPQVVVYAVGAVASALLNAGRRFAAVSFAPVANNVVVTVAMVVFVVEDWGGGLRLTPGAKLLLALGTTGGVVAMAAVPMVAAARAGFQIRPRAVHWREPAMRQVLHLGAWSAAYLACNQLLVAVTLVLANRVAGGVVAYQIAFTFFLLPHALLAHPVFTALYPQLSADATANRWDAFGRDLGIGMRLTLVLVLPASAALVVLGGPALRLVRLGALDAGGASFTGRVLAAYALGLAGYATLLLLVRAATAAGQAKQAAFVGIGVTLGGAGLMVAGSLVMHGTGRVVALGLAHSVAVVGGAAALFAVVRSRSTVAVRLWPSIGRGLAAAAAGGVAGWAASSPFRRGGRADALLALAAGGVAWLGATALVARLLGVPEIAELRSLSASRHAAEGSAVAAAAAAATTGGSTTEPLP